MLFWRPHPDSPLVFFAIAGLWGVGDAVWQTQINGRLFLLQHLQKKSLHFFFAKTKTTTTTKTDYFFKIHLNLQAFMDYCSDVTRKLLSQITDCGNQLVLSLHTLIQPHCVRA